jgi:hypothetical protein
MATCNRCGRAGLTWKEHDEGWRLHVPSGAKHACHDPKARARRRERAESRELAFRRYGDHADEAWFYLA